MNIGSRRVTLNVHYIVNCYDYPVRVMHLLRRFACGHYCSLIKIYVEPVILEQALALCHNNA